MRTPPPPECLQIEHRVQGPAVIVRVAGTVDADAAPSLIEHLTAAALHATPPGPVVVDLRDVHVFGSSGIAALMETHQRCRQRHTELRVLATASVTRPLEITGTRDILTICPTLTEALSGEPN